MKKHKTLDALLQALAKAPKSMKDKDRIDDEIKDLQLKMLRIQQGVFNNKKRVIIMFEGFDAAGKGGTIKTITEALDPRGVRVIPIAAPKPSEQDKHWQYRFWKKLPSPGEIVIFDRSWYGRVLVEKVEELTSKERLHQAHDEINDFERLLQDDGIILIKFFLAITKDEQLKRFEDRLNDPSKQWKITIDDINARKNWDKYVHAVDVILKKNSPKHSHFHMIPANSKKFARREVLSTLAHELRSFLEAPHEAPLKAEKEKLVKLLRKA